MPIEENDGLFKGLKITLIVLYSISLGIVIIMAAMSIFAVSMVGPAIDNEQELSPEDKEASLLAQKAFIVVALVVYSLIILVCIIGLLGVIKENRCIMITICVFGVIGLLGYIYMGRIVESVLSSIATSLDLLFTYMLCKRHKAN